MGIGIFPVFNPRVARAEFQSDGKILAAEFELLDQIALASGVPAFSSFGDNRALPEGFDGDPEELDEILGVWDDWFDPADGLRTVRALLQRLGEAKTASGDAEGHLVGELEELERSLSVAQDAGAQFRLEMG